MAGSPRVQLSLKGRLLSEVAFVGPQLRIGRMRENDVVVNNLAVSRFHAVLKREGDGFVLEDLGSENGTQLNGQPITGSVPMKATDVIQLGKYELRLSQQPNVAIAGPPKAKPSDAWDASQTFLALDPAAVKPAAAPAPVAAAAGAASADKAASNGSLRPVKAHSAPSPLSTKAPAPLAPVALAVPALPEMDALELEAEPPRAADSSPDPDEAFAFGEEEVASLDAGTPDAEIAETGTPIDAPRLEHTSLFDFGAPGEPEAAASADEPDDIAAEFGDLAPPGPALTSPTTPHVPRAATEKLHAGVIVQRDGKLHLLRAWDGGELCAGRAAECDIVLADAGVSRRHAVFACSAGRYTVRDLGSVNGIYVNGKRTRQHELAVGDVVRIESFELTFVLDHSPIGSEVSAPMVVQSKPQETGRATQFSLEASARENAEAFDLAPMAPEANAAAAPSVGLEEDPGDDFEILAPADDAFAAAAGGEAASTEPTAGASLLPESDLISAEGIDDGIDDDDGEKDGTVHGTPGARALHAAAIEARGAGLSLRLSLDPSQLSPRAREALAALAEEGVLMTARISVETE